MTHGRLIAVSLLLVALMALPGWGQDRPAGADGRTIMDSGSLYNALWAVGIFLVLLVVLGRFAWRPILHAIEEREHMVAQTIENAQRQQAESERLLADYRAMLESADEQARQRLEQAQKDAVEARDKILAQAKTEADRLAQAATAEISTAKQQALEDLYAQAADLATRAAERIIRKELTAQDQQRIVQESLEQIRQRARRSQR